MKRGILALALAAGALVVAAAPASAQPACGALARTQTYERWGPAASFGRTVTVVYSVIECTDALADGVYAYELSGDATVFAGEEAAGAPIAVLPFSSTGAFSDPGGDGWPPDWWGCGVAHAAITWEIPEVYSFVAVASEGSWTLDVVVPGAEPLHWEHAACT